MKRLLSLILALILALTLTSCEGEPTPKKAEPELSGIKLTVNFIDVGQGDSILLESMGEYVLIDAGENKYGGDVARYIKKCGVHRLKYVIATHPHSDHIGGMRKVLKEIEADNFITSETDQSTKTWLDVLDMVDKKNINYIDAKAGSTYSFGESTFTILAPLGSGYDGYNNYSVVTKVCCGDVSFMLTGDAEKQSEKEMISSGADLKADVLKCGHHGSSTSSTANFLKAVDPKYAVISCGKDNDYGHPHKETLKKLSLLNCPVYRTDELGTIIADTDGVTLSFRDTEGYDIPEPTAEENTEPDCYIGNKNSHVFHLPTCSGAKSMSEKNKVEFKNRDEAIAQGYTPCSMCDP